MLLALLLVGCQATPEPASAPSGGGAIEKFPTRSPTRAAQQVETALSPTPQPIPTRPVVSPTPDPTHPAQAEPYRESHLVQYGESLGAIAESYNTTIEELMALNDLASPDNLQAGQTLLVPAGELPVGPAEKIIPDSELVYGPAFSHFDVTAVVNDWGGYLAGYMENVEGAERTGPEIVQLVAQRYSVGPRLLLALLEHESGWVTETSPLEETLLYPMGKAELDWDGLFIQLSWTANQLNRGYYGWESGWLQRVSLVDGTLVQLAPGLNAGTVAVQAFLAMPNSFPVWQAQVARDGSLMAIYRAFFGDPFQYAIEPLIPPDLVQPVMALPWEEGETWHFTGAPHGGWGSNSGWAALDFAPGGEQLGCNPSPDWVRAICSGRVVRSENGEVVVDLDDDGYEGTGWSVLYMHIESDGRVPAGAWVEAGEKIGHPSCEGGFSNGTHLHLARRYNGRWIEADGPVPFVMDGWIPESYGSAYDGILTKGEEIREACQCRELEFNGIRAGQ